MSLLFVLPYSPFAKMRAFSLHFLALICSTDSERYSNLSHFQTNIYNEWSCVWKCPTICFFTQLLKNPFYTDQWMLLKHIYRVGTAANHQSTTRICLNKSVTAMMNQHTWKCTTKSDIVWQNWNRNWVVEGAKGIMQSRILLHSCHFIWDLTL